MALSLAETCWRAAGDLTGWLPGSGTAVWSAGRMPGSVFLAGEIQVAVVAAFLLTAALYLLGRGSLYPLWMAILALFGMLAGFLGSIDYAQPWQNDGMALALYLTAAGILICQQVSGTPAADSSRFPLFLAASEPPGPSPLPHSQKARSNSCRVQETC